MLAELDESERIRNCAALILELRQEARRKGDSAQELQQHVSAKKEEALLVEKTKWQERNVETAHKDRIDQKLETAVLTALVRKKDDLAAEAAGGLTPRWLTSWVRKCGRLRRAWMRMKSDFSELRLYLSQIRLENDEPFENVDELDYVHGDFQDRVGGTVLPEMNVISSGEVNMRQAIEELVGFRRIKKKNGRIPAEGVGIDGALLKELATRRDREVNRVPALVVAVTQEGNLSCSTPHSYK